MRGKDQHAREQVQAGGVGLGLQLVELLLWLLGQVLDVSLGTLVADEGNVVVSGRAQGVDHALHLVQLVFAREDGGAAQQLRQDAPDRPDVYLFRIVGGVQDHLWRPLPTRDHLLGQHASSVDVRSPCQAQVANLEVAVLV